MTYGAKIYQIQIIDVFSIYSFQVSSFMYLYHNDALPISFFKLETKFINIQRDTPTITGPWVPVSYL